MTQPRFAERIAERPTRLRSTWIRRCTGRCTARGSRPRDSTPALVLSDIHLDLRPLVARHGTGDGRSWADLVELWSLSYETGPVKPDPAVFALALQRFGLPPDRVLMVGDRGPGDGGGAAAGITTLLLPPLRSRDQRRLGHVLRRALR